MVSHMQGVGSPNDVSITGFFIHSITGSFFEVQPVTHEIRALEDLSLFKWNFMGSTTHYPRPRYVYNVSIYDLLNRIVLETLNKLEISEEFKTLFSGLIDTCKAIAFIIELYLSSRGVNVEKYVLDVYDLGEEEYTELKPYIEVYVRSFNVKEVLALWKNALELMDKSTLKSVDIFFTRAR